MSGGLGTVLSGKWCLAHRRLRGTSLGRNQRCESHRLVGSNGAGATAGHTHSQVAALRARIRRWADEASYKVGAMFGFGLPEMFATLVVVVLGVWLFARRKRG